MSDSQDEAAGPASEPGDPKATENVVPRLPGGSQREAVAIALAVALVTATAIAVVYDPRRAGQSSMLVVLGALNAVLAAFSVARLHRRRELAPLLRPIGGDLSLGAASAGLLYGAAHVVEQMIAKHGTPREAWIVRVYLQLGDGNTSGRALMGVGVLLVATLEEIVWRGLVMRVLGEALGKGRAWVLSSALFALAHVPTVILLGDPMAGMNPLIMLAALGGSLVWGALLLRTQRLVPAIFSHALFAWAIVEFPIWHP